MGKRGVKAQGEVPKWSAEVAYAVGLLASDGSLSRDGRHIDFTSKDLEQVTTLKRILKKSNPVREKRNGVRGVSYRIQFGDVVFYDWLQNIGLTPAKSRTMGPLHIPDKLFFHFLRGLWDGDGTIYSYMDARWESSFVFYISFATGSERFARWLQSSVLQLGLCNGRIFLPAREHTYQVRFAKKESKKLFALMFPNAAVPHLARKFAKAQEIFKMDGCQE